jgi:hypothetical protein
MKVNKWEEQERATDSVRHHSSIQISVFLAREGMVKKLNESTSVRTRKTMNSGRSPKNDSRVI